MNLDLKAEITTYFEVCDADKDGLLTLDEVQAPTCKKWEEKEQERIPNVTIDDLVWIFGDADTDGDEKLSKKEIVAELAKDGITE